MPFSPQKRKKAVQTSVLEIHTACDADVHNAPHINAGMILRKAKDPTAQMRVEALECILK